MKIGLIGTGRIAGAHCNAIEHLNELQLLTCFDTSQHAMKIFSERYACLPSNTAESVIEKSDLVIIASPNHSHHQYALSAMKAGKWVLCEKPMASHIDQAKEMHGYFCHQNTKAFIGFNYRFMPIIYVIRKVFHEDILGEVINISFSFKKNSALERKKFTWRDGADSQASSGALGDLGVHFIDLIPFLFGQDINVFSARSKIKTNVTHKEKQQVAVDDYAYVSGRIENGAYFNFYVSKSSPAEECGFSIDIIGSRSELKYHSKTPECYYVKENIYWEETSLKKNKNLIADPEKEVPGWSDSFYHQLKQLINNPDKKVATFSDGYKAQIILDYLTKDYRQNISLTS